MQNIITDEVSAINKVLTEKIGPQKFRIWFESSTRFSLVDGYLKVGVPNLFIAGWIENHFLQELKDSVRDVTGDSQRIMFVVDSELSGQNRKSKQQTCDFKKEWLHKPKGVKKSVGSKKRKRLKLNFSTFIVGRSNELAFNAAKAVVSEEKSPFNPLFIHGGYGVGKTHLLQGICNEVGKTRPGTNWLYLSAEDFVNQFVLALKTRKLEAFRRRLRQTELLAIDDIHFLASKPSTQEEFLHTFNSIDLSGKQVVMASDAHPKMIGQLSEKLVNRFISGMVVKIEQPDLETRCNICQQYTERMGKHVPESVSRYMAENLRTNVRELEGAILKLTAFASLQGKRITLGMAKEMMSEHLERCDPIVHISDIESAVAAYFDITPSKLHSSKKDKTLALARHFSMYLTRLHTKMSSSEIGRFMGKNHATVLVACKKIEDLINRNAELSWKTSNGNRVAKTSAVLERLEQSISS
ncbi:MAG: chromosomal replication initiator protein DnaA [Planctomycetota bacterium]